MTYRMLIEASSGDDYNEIFIETGLTEDRLETLREAHRAAAPAGATVAIWVERED